MFSLFHDHQSINVSGRNGKPQPTFCSIFYHLSYFSTSFLPLSNFTTETTSSMGRLHIQQYVQLKHLFDLYLKKYFICHHEMLILVLHTGNKYIWACDWRYEVPLNICIEEKQMVSNWSMPSTPGKFELRTLSTIPCKFWDDGLPGIRFT